MQAEASNVQIDRIMFCNIIYIVFHDFVYVFLDDLIYDFLQGALFSSKENYNNLLFQVISFAFN